MDIMVTNTKISPHLKEFRNERENNKQAIREECVMIGLV